MEGEATRDDGALARLPGVFFVVELPACLVAHQFPERTASDKGTLEKGSRIQLAGDCTMTQ